MMKESMMNADPMKWRRSSRCGSNACVEVAEVAGGIAMRDSKDENSPVLVFTEESWNAFVAGVMDGEFEQLR
jgi:hypothetical protein